MTLSSITYRKTRDWQFTRKENDSEQYNKLAIFVNKLISIMKSALIRYSIVIWVPIILYGKMCKTVKTKNGIRKWTKTVS